MVKILVTGGSGMVGAALVEKLVKDGHEVNMLDIHDVKIEGTNYIQGTILSPMDIDKAMDGCEYVVHLAATVGVDRSLKAPLECLDVNVLGTRNMLEASVKNDIKRFVFSSSSEIYGEPRELPILETADYSPKSEYGASKVIGEEYIKAYSKKYNLDYTILRFFNVYGEQRNEFVVPLFITAALKNETLKLFGDGQQTRAFCYVDDIVQGICKGIFEEKAKNEIFNIGNPGGEVSMEQLAQKIVEISGSQSKIEHVEFGDKIRGKWREVFKRVPEIKKAQEKLGYEPKWTIEDGLKAVIDYYKENLDKYVEPDMQGI